jgi:hypothetical protein
MLTALLILTSATLGLAALLIAAECCAAFDAWPADAEPAPHRDRS